MCGSVGVSECGTAEVVHFGGFGGLMQLNCVSRYIDARYDFCCFKI